MTETTQSWRRERRKPSRQTIALRPEVLLIKAKPGRRQFSTARLRAMLDAYLADELGAEQQAMLWSGLARALEMLEGMPLPTPHGREMTTMPNGQRPGSETR
jgi:hypothetical protein